MNQKEFIKQLKKGNASIKGIGEFSVRKSKNPHGQWCKKVHFRCDKKVLSEL